MAKGRQIDNYDRAAIKAVCSIAARINSVGLNVSKRQTQRHQFRPNPSPNGYKSKSRSSFGNKRFTIKGINIGRPFKPLQHTLNLPLIYWPCHSHKIINKLLISHGGGLKKGRTQAKKRRNREKLEFYCHHTPRPPSDFCPATDYRQTFATVFLTTVTRRLWFFRPLSPDYDLSDLHHPPITVFPTSFIDYSPSNLCRQTTTTDFTDPVHSEYVMSIVSHKHCGVEIMGDEALSLRARRRQKLSPQH
ncbi:hypothetical protein M5K25_003433 [Dendrobium thyrsiflorum]|uniref:Uncharacterized protein n=1 Tax=Dendrobium thyrsiflorum TaxID=117978 RepID=A0ABD0VRS3_DENTH